MIEPLISLLFLVKGLKLSKKWKKKLVIDGDNSVCFI